jgi:hypothetical protein
VGTTYLGLSAGYDSFILKYNSSGALIWENNYSTADNLRFIDVEVGSNGDIFVVGWIVNISQDDVFFLKLNDQGVPLWNVTWDAGTGGHDKAESAAIDSNDNIYIAGSSVNSSSGKTGALLMKFNSEGTVIWNATWGGILNNDYGNEVGLDGNYVYLVGTTSSVGAGGTDAFLAKYDLDGHSIWSRTLGGAANDKGYGFAVDTSHNIYFTGSTENFGAAEIDGFIAKYNSAGDSLWTKTFGGAYQDFGNSLAIDSQRNIYVTGKTEPVDSGMLAKFDGLFAIFDSNGQFLWSTTWGITAGSEEGKAIILNDTSIYFTGLFYNESAVDNNAIVFKYHVEISSDTSGIPGFQFFGIFLPLIVLLGFLGVQLRRRPINAIEIN